MLKNDFGLVSPQMALLMCFMGFASGVCVYGSRPGDVSA